MDDHFDKKQLDKAKQLATSPQGKQLLSALMAADPNLMRNVSSAVSSNDYSRLAATLSPLLESDSVKNLLKQMGE